MKGRWHLLIGTIMVVLSYFLVLANLSLALTMVMGALLPDFDLIVFGKYKRSQKTGELKFVAGIKAHRDGFFHSLLAPSVVLLGYVFRGGYVDLIEWRHVFFFTVAVWSHIVADFHHCKGRIRFFNGKRVLRGHGSTWWLVVNTVIGILVMVYVLGQL